MIFAVSHAEGPVEPAPANNSNINAQENTLTWPAPKANPPDNA